jgi:hypothetical protein
MWREPRSVSSPHPLRAADPRSQTPEPAVARPRPKVSVGVSRLLQCAQAELPPGGHAETPAVDDKRGLATRAYVCSACCLLWTSRS